MAIIQNLVALFTADTRQFEAGTKRAGQHLGYFQKSAKAVGSELLRMAGLGGGIYLVERGLRKITTAAIEQEKADKLLKAAVGGNIDALKSYASQIQKVTIYGDEEIQNQMAYAANLGVTRDKLQEATTAAVGLAAKYKIDLQAAMMLVGRASKGQMQTLTRYGIVLDQTKTKEEQFNDLLKIGAGAFKLAAAEAKTASGTFAQWKNASGDLAEVLGNKLLPKLTEVTKQATEIIQTDWGDIWNTLTEGPDVVFNKSIEKQIRELERLKSIPLGVGFGGSGRSKTNQQIDSEINALKEQIKLRNQANAEARAAGTDGAAATDSPYEIILPNDEDIAAMSAAQDKINQQTMRMYADMGDYGDEYRKLVEVNLDSEVEAYKQAGIDEVLLARWRANELKRLEDEIAESRMNAIDRWVDHYTSMEEVANDFAESYAAGLDDLGSKMTDWMKTGKMDWESWTDSLLTNWMDTLNKMAVAEAQKSIINPLISSVVGAVVGGIGGSSAGSSDGAGTISQDAVYSHTFHRGGIVGSTSTPTRMMSSGMFANAPRLHSGLMSDEFPAILQKGEQVIPKNSTQNSGQSTPNFKIVIVRNEQEAFEEYLNSARGEKVLLKKQAKNNKYF